MRRHTIASATALFLSLIGCAGSPQKTLPSGAHLPGTANIETYPVEHLAVRALIERFSDAANHADWKATEEMFTEDAVWEVQAPPPMGWTFEGRDAIRAGMTGNLDRVELRVQTVSPTAIQVQGPERATARSTLDEVLRFKDTGKDVRIVGTYSDQLVKQEGQWKFARRTFIPRFEEPLPTRSGN
ncbi:nuclear transport factor 2 family protein [Myxococcus landrumensis]|uniref:Nuclear transport factor 2 family protein n=1 Tax=Myxococcus landrumensis TaxID=2813577 RepID=A0ABX7N843_9BACT|nr:nuclear transport factor 2 family protein [Myxococcus landrumus]QSQ13822.1 nuclear transport factor 2 family protein [Myxococcus landrumus]